MENHASFIPVTPNRAIPKILGILNIVFAAALILGGLCWLSSLIMSPYMLRMMNEAQKKAEAEANARHKADLKQLEEEEKTAKTEEEKAEIREMVQTSKARTNPVMLPGLDFTKLMANPQIIRWSWAEIVTGLALNSLMLASGIGLVLFKPWGRTLGIWIAGLKIARLTLVYGYFAFSIVPVFSRTLGEAVSAMMIKQQQAMGRPAPPMLTPEFFTRMYTVTYTVISIGMIVVGSIYPLVVIWFLSRPSARAACSELKPVRKQDEPW